MAIIGSAYVNIRAITDKLESDIERALAGIKDTITIQVDADTSRAKAKIDELTNSVLDEELFMPLFVETSHAEQTVEDFVDKSSRKNINIPVDAATVLANRQIAWAARPRFVEIFARLNKASWVKALTAIQAMSGSRVLINYFDDLTDAISNMDKNAVKVTTLTLALTNLASAGIAAVGGIITVINDLFAALGLLIIAPGIFAGFVAGALTSFLALKDMKTVLKDLGPAFTALQDQISADFWGEAEKPIREMVDRLLPDLREGFGLTSKSIGSFFGEFATQMANAFDEGVFVRMMQNVADSTDIAKAALADMTSSIAILGSVGSSYLPRLATWWVKLNEDFNNFLVRADADGTLVKWADNAIEQTKLVGRSLWAIGEMFYEIDKAATAAGGTGLLALTQNLEHFADLLGSPIVQDTLTRLFRGAGDAMSSLATGIGQLGAGFAAASPSIEIALRTAGSAFAMLLSGMGAAMANPLFGGGLEKLFDGLHGAIQMVYPAMSDLGGIFGQFIGLIGTVAASIGRVLGPAIQAIAPLAGPVFQIIGTLFTALSSAMSQLINAAAPAIAVFAGWLSQLSEKLAGANPFFVAMGAAAAALVPFVGMLVSGIVGLATTLGPIIASMGGLSAVMARVGGAFSALFGPVGIVIGLLATMYATSAEFRGAINGVIGAVVQLVGSLVGTLLPPLMNLVQSILPVVVGLFTTIAPIIGQVVASFTPLINMIGTMLVPMLGQLVTGILPLVASVFQVIAQVVTSVVTAIAPFISAIIPALLPLLTTLVSALQPIITAFMGILNAVIPVVNTLIGTLVPVFTELAATVFPVAAQVITMLAGVINTLVAAILPLITTIIASLMPVITSILVPAIQFLGDVFKAVFDAIVPIVQAALQIIQGVIQVFSGLVTGNWSQMWDGIKNIVSGAFNLVINAISGAFRIIFTTVVSGAQNIVEGFKGIIGSMWQVGVDIMNGLKDGLVSMITNLVNIAKDIGNNIMGGIKDVLGIKSPSRVMRDQVGIQIGNGLAEGLRRSEAIVEKAAASLAKAAIPDIKPIRTSMTVDTSRTFSGVAPTVPTTLSSLNAQGSAGNPSGAFSAPSSVPSISLTVNPSEKMDEKEIGRSAASELFWQFINR